MNLIEYEQTIKGLVKENKSNPDIYNYLQEMTLLFLRRKKPLDSSQYLLDVSYTIAGDIFLKIIDGADMTYYLGYLERIYRDYLREEKAYLSKTFPFEEVYEHTEIPELIIPPISLKDAANEIYLKKINQVIERIMKKCCKYRQRSKEYLNLKLSLVLSILRDTRTYFHLEEEQIVYLDFLLVRLYDELKVVLL